MALNSLGNAMREVGRFKDAIIEYQDAVAIFRDTGDRQNEHIAMSNLEAARVAQLGLRRSAHFTYGRWSARGQAFLTSHWGAPL